MNDDCPTCGGGFYAGRCENGYHPWTYKSSWPPLKLRPIPFIDNPKVSDTSDDLKKKETQGQ